MNKKFFMTMIKATGVPPSSFTDDFNSYNDGALDGQGPWVDILGSFTVVSNAVQVGSGDEAGSMVDLPFNDNQYAKSEIANIGNNRFIGVAVRCASNGNYYGLYADNNEIYVFRATSSTWVELGGVGQSVSGGDILELRAEGSNLTCLLNGVPISGIGTDGVVVDSTYSSGNIGICGYDGHSTSQIDNFEGGDL